MTTLEITDNQITILENLPSSLIEMYISNNQLINIENLPSSLTRLNGVTYIHKINLNNYITPLQSNTIDECPICYSGNSDCKLSCNHTFHKECILIWLQKKITCPYCRIIPR